MNYLQSLQPLNETNQRLQSSVHPTDWINPEPTGRYNLVIVGAGTAGLVTAAGAAGLGAKVALVERGLMGGDCLNVGCVPSKALISAARHIAAIRNSHRYGIQSSQPEVDFAEIMQRMRRLRADISPHDSAKRFSELGVDVYFGQGCFVGNDSIAVSGKLLNYKRAVIATGARAAELPIPGLKESGYLTNETLFSLVELPRRLVVIGGGPIGCEMAQCFARFGSDVTLIEKSANVLSREDTDAALVVQNAIEADGVRFLLKARVQRVEQRNNQKILHVEVDQRKIEVVADEILLGIGRTPNVDGLGLDKVGVTYNTATGVQVDDFLRTTNRKIYAAGDVCSKFKFTHCADFTARIVIQNTLFMGRAKASRLLVPWCTFTSPELAHVGILPGRDDKQSPLVDTYTLQFANVDRAILDDDENGFVRVHCRKGTDEILGATIVGSHAGDMLSEITLAMKNRIGLRDISSTIHPYPTRAEAIRKLGDQYNRTRLTPFVKSLFSKWLSLTR